MNDWDTVTVIGNRRAAAGGSANKEKQLNMARRQGMEIATSSKYGGGSNTQKQTSLNTMKLDQETEELRHKTVDMSVGKAIQKGRQQKELTQKELATKINEKPQVVVEYEQGKAIPNQAILSKMERTLGIKLRGKGIGQPLEAKPKKTDKK
eukprot:TRINITY_DN2110_c0_g1_i1.p1 TRINITY_DN2110_c0_g1~~TRINITY_DN2110_c0_g1_i1.p1  ORF type:complete len:166 (-),score=56.72 TRINITY_DN2110_c0_g1_i1:475-927(-)